MAIRLLLLSHPALFPEVEKDNFANLVQNLFYWHKKNSVILDIGLHRDIIPQSRLFTYGISVLTETTAIVSKREKVIQEESYTDKRKLILPDVPVINLWEYDTDGTVLYWGLVYISEEKPPRRQYKKRKE